ncbi:hypothetical protein AAU61_12070 [Desulfocarbo indianensis]|nr:hypothetical protein AAU61_12070 [Desulfocarbo indianensis]
MPDITGSFSIKALGAAFGVSRAEYGWMAQCFIGQQSNKLLKLQFFQRKRSKGDLETVVGFMAIAKPGVNIEAPSFICHVEAGKVPTPKTTMNPLDQKAGQGLTSRPAIRQQPP